MFIMKKKLVAVISLFVIILIGGYTVYSSQNNVKLSDLVLANVEALAEYESPDVEITCNGKKNTPPGRCWHQYADCDLGWFHHPEDCRFSGSMSDTCLTPCE